MTGWEVTLLRLVIGLRVRGEAAGHISEGTLNLAFDRFAKIPTQSRTKGVCAIFRNPLG